MELIEPQSPQDKQKKKHGLVIVLVIALLAAITAIILLVTREPEVQETGKIGYSESAVILDSDQPIEYTPPEAMTLNYKGTAVSKDGKTFDCSIINDTQNTYDMYIDIYADNTLTDEIFLYELFKPGTGFEEITLNRALDPGVHTAFLVFTQVEDDHKTMHNQLVVTIDLVVE